MFGGKYYYVMVIRRMDGSIDYFKFFCKYNLKLNIVKKILFLWGIVVIIEVSVNGIKYLNFLSECYGFDLVEDEIFE